jgi:hypothetical protein
MTKEITEKLYVCLNDDDSISLQSRDDVDSVIKNAEENLGSLPFTVLGHISIPLEGSPFLFTCTQPKTVFFEVITATNEDEAKDILLNKKRLKNKTFKIQAVRDLSELVKKYYE